MPSSDYTMPSSHYSTLHLRQSVIVPAHKSHKRMDVGSERFPYHSQNTLPSTTTSYHPLVVDSNRPCHPSILRSSCSLPAAPTLQRHTSSCQVDDVVSRLRMQITSDPSLGIVERRNRNKTLPQFKPGAFVLTTNAQLTSEEIKRLNILLDITTATVRDPDIFHHLLEGETRILLDPVSQKMQIPAVVNVVWRQSCGDVASQASTSTSTSLNVSLTSMGAIDETENMSIPPSAGPLCSQMVSQHYHWALRIRDVANRQSMYNTDAAAAKLITRDTRQSVVTWMSKVIEAMGWPLNSFFTAVHAMDYSLKKMSSTMTGRSFSVPDSSVPLLSTACVLVGVSAECEHRQLQKARAFVGQVPHVASVKEIVCKQLAVVAGLDRGTLLHKTPLDFIIYYLAAIRYYSQEIEEHRCAEELGRDCTFWDKLFLLSTPIEKRRSPDGSHCVILPYVLQCGESKKEDNASLVSFIELVIEGALAISVSCYLEYMHSFIPISRVVAALMFTSFTLIEESFKDMDFCTGFCRRVFALDYATELRPVLTEVMPLVYMHISRQLKGGRSSDKSDVPADPITICNDSTFTSWSHAAMLLLEYLEEVTSFGPSAFPQ